MKWTWSSLNQVSEYTDSCKDVWVWGEFVNDERERERESIKVLETHGAHGTLISMSGICLI